MTKSRLINPATNVPFELNGHGPRRRMVRELSPSSQFPPSNATTDSILERLAAIQATPQAKASQPFKWHPWIFAAAYTVATVANSAPFTIFRETEQQLDRRRIKQLRTGRPWRGAESGSRRRALQRHVSIPLRKRLATKSLEVDDTHPLWDVLTHPNPQLVGDQLFWVTHLLLALKGQCMWVLSDEEGEPSEIGEVPERIWPMPSDLFTPILSNGEFGDQIGWKFHPMFFMPERLKGQVLTLPLESVIQFKVPDPFNLMQAISRVAITLEGVETDLGLKELNRALVANDATPGGVIEADSSVTEEEEAEFIKRWEQRHRGGYRNRKLAMLSAGLKFVPTMMTPVDLQGLQQLEWNRSEHLAVLGVPPSQVGLENEANYASALVHQRGFWDNTVLPLQKVVDTTLDGTLFFQDPDDIVGMHDLRNVEALRAGLTEKIANAKALCGAELHAPPETAYEVVGLEVPEYEGDDVALISSVVSPVKDLLEGGLDDDETDPEPPPDEEPADDEEPAEPPPEGESLVKATKAPKRWTAFARVQGPLEVKLGKRYARWVASERKQALARLNDAAKRRNMTQRVVNVDAVIPTLGDSQRSLKIRVRPLFLSMLNETWEFTAPELGVPSFEIDDERILAVFQARENMMVLGTPKTVRANLIRSLSTGIANGETLAQLRVRIQEVYGAAATPAKVLSVARTETAGLMNTVRDSMFRAQGFSRASWTTAGDEEVREDHKVFGKAGPQDMGFNWLTLVGKAGSLHHPSEAGAPPAQVINCRCIMEPVE